MSDDSIEILSGVSAFSGEPFVQVRWGRESGQLTPAEARMHALHVLEAAEASESDALLVAMLTDQDPEGLGLNMATASGFITELRQRRVARWKR